MNSVLKKFPQFLLIPNMVSLLNFFCGFISIMMTARGRLGIATWSIFIAFIFDSLDGNIARIFNNFTPLGRELDSLADLVSFVVAPAFLALTFLWAKWSAALFLVILFYLACGIFRLARFNTRTPVNGYFEGLPTPAAALLISMAVSACIHHNKDDHFMIVLLLFFSGVLMISRIHYPKISAVPVSKWKALIFLELLMGAFIFMMFNIEASFATMIFIYVFFAPVLQPVTMPRKRHR